jgi:hypothetical protein
MATSTGKQLRQAVAVLMRFLEEYQTVNRHNADAIVEYERKVRFITDLLAAKKFDGLKWYSFLDLLNARAQGQICPTDGHQMECILNHDFVGDHDCVLVCPECRGCRHDRHWPNCSNCGVAQWEKK